jgi:electron transport complex protein RnfC
VLKTFTRGGIHPPEEKLSAHTSIQTLPLPATAIIPVSQHLGAPAKIIAREMLLKPGRLSHRETDLFQQAFMPPFRERF